MKSALLEADQRTSTFTPMSGKRRRPSIPPLKTYSWPDWDQTFTGSSNVELVTSTSANPVALPAPPALPAALYEIRRISGLTWDELATVFGVTRRSLHNWANGDLPSPERAIRVRRVLGAIRQLDRRSAAETRLSLLTPGPKGESPLYLLTQDQLGQAIALFNKSARLTAPVPAHPNTALLRPGDLMGALTDRPAPHSGAFIPGRSRRLPKRRP